MKYLISSSCDCGVRKTLVFNMIMKLYLLIKEKYLDENNYKLIGTIN